MKPTCSSQTLEEHYRILCPFLTQRGNTYITSPMAGLNGRYLHTCRQPNIATNPFGPIFHMRVWTPSQTHVSSPQIDSTSYWLELEVDQMVKVGQMAKSVFTHTDTPSRTILPHKIVGRLGVLRVEFLSKNPSISSSNT